MTTHHNRYEKHCLITETDHNHVTLLSFLIRECFIDYKKAFEQVRHAQLNNFLKTTIDEKNSNNDQPLP